MMNQPIPRREFVKKTSLGVALAATSGVFSARSYAAIDGANDRIRIAILGTHRRFEALLGSFAQISNIQITWLCDINGKMLEMASQKSQEVLGYVPQTSGDLRKVVAAEDVDAVFVLLPDHWHATATWMALQNGKHVYVEKPCSHNLREDELLIQWSRQYKPIIQIGTQQRSSLETIEAIQRIHAGEIGQAYEAFAFYCNTRGELKQPEIVSPPDYFDWELFQGPAPRTGFPDVVEDYNWHWFWHWGTAETGNNATHELDVARWALQVRYPSWVSVVAGKRHFADDGWQMYDTMDASMVFEGDKRIRWDGKSRNGFNTYGGSGRGTIIYGTEGTIYVDRDGYRMHDRGGKLVHERWSVGQEGSTALGGGGDMTTLHLQNFMDAIRGDAKQNAPIEEGAYSTHLCHYANISARMQGKLLKIDPQTGHFANAQVMQEYWSRAYEPGWELE